MGQSLGMKHYRSNVCDDKLCDVVSTPEILAVSGGGILSPPVSYVFPQSQLAHYLNNMW